MPAGRNGGLSLVVSVDMEKIYVSISGDFFYYSNQGYDKIKVGYTPEETSDACKEFAIALAEYLADYYASLDISVSKEIYGQIKFDWSGEVSFWVNLTGVQPRLKQV